MILLSQCQELVGIVMTVVHSDPVVTVSRSGRDCVDCCSGPVVTVSRSGRDSVDCCNGPVVSMSRIGRDCVV